MKKKKREKVRRLLADNVAKKGSEALKTRRYKNERKGERRRGEERHGLSRCSSH